MPGFTGFLLRATDAMMASLLVLFAFGFFSLAAKEFRHAYDEAAIEAQLHPVAEAASGSVRPRYPASDCLSGACWSFY